MLSTDRQTNKQTNRQTDKLTKATKNITSFTKEVMIETTSSINDLSYFSIFTIFHLQMNILPFFVKFLLISNQKKWWLLELANVRYYGHNKQLIHTCT